MKLPNHDNIYDIQSFLPSFSASQFQEMPFSNFSYFAQILAHVSFKCTSAGG